MYASQKFKFRSSFRWPATHVRHTQGHQRAGAITGSNNIFQSTTIKVYEVEHQKTVNTKSGKQTTWFSEVIKQCHHYFQENQGERHKKKENKVALHS